MPVIGIDIQNFKSMIGEDISNKQLVKVLQELGCDVEGFATLKRFQCSNCQGITEVTDEEEIPAACSVCGIDYRENKDKVSEISPIEVLRMELLAVRPDMFDAGGLSRVVKGYLGKESGLKEYRLYDHNEKITVDKSIIPIRPFIVSAVIKNIVMNDDFIKAIMKLQENLHWALGRNRKHASIGVYDFDKVKGPFTYTAKEKSFKFIPLGYQMTEENRISLDRILKEHPKGLGYAFIIEEFDKYPMLLDSTGTVLSMPPIINSEDTKVTKDTKNIIIDVTGPIERVINKALNILVTSVLEYYPKAVCEKVEIKYPERTVITPDFTIENMKLNIPDTAKLIGIDLNADSALSLIKKMRHKALKIDNDNLMIGIPPYRNDIFHPRDLMEDVAIAYGYHNIKTKLIETMTVGQENPVERNCNIARFILTGLGFLEITTLMLSNSQNLYERVGLSYNDNTVEIENPISADQTILRTHLISGLLETFKLNIHNDLPQKLFEVGNAAYVAESETGAVDEKRVCAGIIGQNASFSEIKAYFIAFMKEMAFSWKLEEAKEDLFIKGRGAYIIVDAKKCGLLGEVHPKILTGYHLVNPVALFEMKILSPDIINF